MQWMVRKFVLIIRLSAVRSTDGAAAAEEKKEEKKRGATHKDAQFLC